MIIKSGRGHIRYTYNWYPSCSTWPPATAWNTLRPARCNSFWLRARHRGLAELNQPTVFGSPNEAYRTIFDGQDRLPPLPIVSCPATRLSKLRCRLRNWRPASNGQLIYSFGLFPTRAADSGRRCSTLTTRYGLFEQAMAAENAALCKPSPIEPIGCTMLEVATRVTPFP